MRVGPAADIYALGTILYEMLTGRPPFDADSVAGTIVRLLHEEPLSPARLRPGLPRDLVTICLKCLEKAPHRRYASALDLAEDLRRFQAGEPIQARPVGVLERGYRWCRRRPLVAALLALVGVLALAFAVTAAIYDVRLEEALAQVKARDEQERQEIVRLNVQLGVVALEQDDAFTAVLHFTEALRADEGRDERPHRTRIATTLRQCPQLVSRGAGTFIPFRHSSDRAALDPGGRLLAVAGARGLVTVYDLDSGTMKTLRANFRGPAVHPCFPVDQRNCLLIPGEPVRSWAVDEDEPHVVGEFSTGASVFSVFSANGRWLFTLDGSGRARVWDTLRGRATAGPLQLLDGAQHGAIRPDGRCVALVGRDRILHIWNVPTGSPVGRAISLPGEVSELSFSPDGQRLVTASGPGCAQLWDVATGALRTTWSGLDGAVTRLEFSPDGRLLLLLDAAGTVRISNAASGQAVVSLLRRAAWAGFRDGGKEILTLGQRGTVSVWRLPRGPVVGELAAGEEAEATPLVLHPVSSPDGRWLAKYEAKGTVRICAADTREPVSPPLHHRADVQYAAFSPDGRRLLTADFDGVARVWETATGQPLTPVLRHDREVRRVFFSADGNRACVVQEGGVVSRWNLTPEDRSIDKLIALSQTLRGEAEPGAR
jgi:WD40 repeat protein